MARAGQRPAGSARAVALQALAIFIATRVMLFGANWFTLRIMPRLDLYPAQLPDFMLAGSKLLDGWSRWDISHYVAIAHYGYGDPRNPSHDGGLGFFPLFPELMRLPFTVSGIEVTDARLAAIAILIANACALVAVPLFAVLVNRQFGTEIAMTATLLLCVSPFSYFLSAGYSESLFLFLVVATLSSADRRWWWLAAGFVALAGATRLVGLALPPALLLLASQRRASLRDLAGIAVISPLGTLGFFAWTWWRFDDPLAYFHAQQNWGNWDDHVGFYLRLFATDPKEALLGDPRHLVIVLNVALLVGWAATIRAMWTRLDAGMALFSTLIIVIHGVMTWVSLGRYLLPAIGAYVVVAMLLVRPGWRGWPRDVIVTCSVILMTMLSALFAHGFWAI